MQMLRSRTAWRTVPAHRTCSCCLENSASARVTLLPPLMRFGRQILVLPISARLLPRTTMPRSARPARSLRSIAHGASASSLPWLPCYRSRHAPREGRLKIGYLSPDLRDHSVAFFIEPILQAHSATVEVYCYSTAPKPDAVTTRLRALVPHWRDVASLSDISLAGLIRDDGIDVLVDLDGHTLNNRLTIFAMCGAAPVQATYGIGYPSTHNQLPKVILGVSSPTELRSSDRRLKPLLPEPLCHQDLDGSGFLLEIPAPLGTYRS